MKTSTILLGALVNCLSASSFAQGLTVVEGAYPIEGATPGLSTLLPFSPAPGAPKKLASIPAPKFDVTKEDKTVRETLARWAFSAGWAHEMSHWTLDRDHPIEGLADSSQFGPDFRGAVRKLLASTENTDRPAQPCFYSNSVVRVIAKAEMCDRSGSGQ